MIRLAARLVRGVSYLTLTAAFLIAPPWLLAHFAGWPLPRSMPTGDQLSLWLEQPLDGGRMVKLVVIFLWLLWTFFAVVIGMEIVGRVRRVRAPRIRIATPLQGVAAGLVGATATAFSTAAAHAGPPPAPVDPAVATQADRTTPAAARTVPAATADAMGTPAVAVNNAAVGDGARYVIARGDRLANIAHRFLGDANAYPRLAALNPQLEARDHRFPDHIEAGWVLHLPADAHDSGARTHATGHLITTAAHLPEAPTAAPTADRTQPTRTPATTSPTAYPVNDQPAPRPAPSVASEQHNAGAQEDGSDDGPQAGSHGGNLAGAGLLTTLILRALTAARRRQQPYFAAGTTLPNPRGGRTERRLLSAQRPADVDRLDAALRDLSTVLNERSVVPDIIGVRAIGGDVHLLLSTPAGPAPAPWLDEGTQWVLPAYHELSGPPGQVAPLPALATVASRSGRHLMLDLERLGTLSIGGNPERGHELLTYIACELALSVWSEHVAVELVGFGDYGDLIAELNPDRVSVRRDPVQAVAELRTRVAVEAGALADGEHLDTLALRLRGEPNDPRVLLIARPDDNTRAQLHALDRELAAVGRCGIAAVATTRDTPIGQAAVTVGDDATLHAHLPWLTLSTDAAALPVDELEPLAEIMHLGRATAPAPAAADDSPAWDVPVDPVTAAPMLFDPAFATIPTQRIAPEDQPAPDDAVLPVSTAMSKPGTGDADANLDADLAAWYDPDADIPKLAIMGRITVTGKQEPDRHRRQAGELAIFLLSRPDHAATREQIEDALWSGNPVNQITARSVVSGLRKWLGNAPDGQPWLSDTGRRPGGAYRLQPGVLLDWHLFLRLRERARRRGEAGTDDLREALRLVRGVPFEGNNDATLHRQTYTWLPESSLTPGRIVPAITDVAHRLARHLLDGGDPTAVRWVISQAWLADPYRGTDDLWLDLMRVERAEHNHAALNNLLAELLKAREAEYPEDLPPATYQALRTLLPERV